MITIAIVTFWVACGVLDYGLLLAHLQHRFPSTSKDRYEADRLFCLMVSAMGPMALLAIVITGYCRHGLMYWRPKK